jgi:hypothetical protein
MLWKKYIFNDSYLQQMLNGEVLAHEVSGDLCGLVVSPS